MGTKRGDGELLVHVSMEGSGNTDMTQKATGRNEDERKTSRLPFSLAFKTE